MFRETLEDLYRSHGYDGNILSTFQRQEIREDREASHARAAEIAGRGDYASILDTLRKEGLLGAEQERVEREYALGAISFVNEHDKEMFTVLDLYDPGTARHCLETYKIAKEEMEIRVDGNTSFAELLEKREGVTLEQFYRACLFHDIGKVSVPRSVIRHHMGDGAMLGCMHRIYHDLYEAGKIPASLGLTENATNDAIDLALEQHRARAVYFVPVHEAFADDPEALAEVLDFGFTGDKTLMDIIKTHEPRSGTILAAAGLPVESDLAAHHHNYNNERLRYPLTTDTLHISVDLADMLHIADVMQALSAKRSYKGALRMPEIMRVIVEHAQDKKIRTASAYIVLNDALQKYEASAHETTDELTDHEDETNLAVVRLFLKKEREQASKPKA